MSIAEREQVNVDGRHRRAQANREAIVEALVSFYADGYVDPSAAEIAERAGVSERSLFRHFDDIDDLCHTAFVVQWKRLADRTRLLVAPTASTDEKIAAVVEQRVGLYLDMMNVMRITRMHAVRNDTVLRHVQSSRKELRKQIERLFAPECEVLPTEKAKSLLLTINALLSFEHVEQLRVDQGMPSSRIVLSLRIALSSLFGDVSL